jgi:putative (di)nucleoside polyphosphate hydrolase
MTFYARLQRSLQAEITLASGCAPLYPGIMVRYRPNVALILRRADGRVLIAERSDVLGAWQFPQGGVAEGESPEEALHREVLEEISLLPDDYRIVEKRGPYRYDFPAGRTKDGCGGQEQTYFLADFVGDEAMILTQPSTEEFRAVCWVKPEEFQLVWVAPMKRAVYRAVLFDFFGVSPVDQF